MVIVTHNLLISDPKGSQFVSIVVLLTIIFVVLNVSHFFHVFTLSVQVNKVRTD